eukprot:4385242-Prymnesium_polylepis.1
MPRCRVACATQHAPHGGDGSARHRPADVLHANKRQIPTLGLSSHQLSSHPNSGYLLARKGRYPID